MAQYKVPQDVEADDKLIGPFSFRQFIYLIIVSLAALLAWFLGQLFLPLAFIPMPVILLFGALALPLRKDQPMEIYLLAIASYFLKPRKRLWDPDGIDSLIEITVPKIVEVQRTKDLSQNEAQRRFSYLAEVVDTRGWSVRGLDEAQAPNSSINSDVFNEAQQTRDILDDDDTVVQSIEQKLNQSTTNRRQEMMSLMQKPINEPANTVPTATATATADEPDVKFNPYPTEIKQSVIQPIDESNKTTTSAVNTSGKVVSTDIINLASNTDLSVAAIAREANRIQEKQDQSKEVVVNLR